MGNNQFRFKQFLVQQKHCAMKVSTDSCLFGAWVAHQVSHQGKALDIGAGTGLLSLMISQQSPELLTDAIEIEHGCHAQMNVNLQNSPWSDRIIPILGDVRTYNPFHRYQIIFSNPPFYERQLKSPTDEVNLARHGSSLTLKEFFTHSERLLENDGDLFVLMPYYRLDEVIHMASTCQLHPTEVVSVKHSRLHTPFRNMFRFGKKQTAKLESHIIIHDDNGSYTEEFKSLLSPYYLNL